MYESNWENLANAIIYQACKDYVKACIFLRKQKPGRRSRSYIARRTYAESMRNQVERFFKSQWFRELTAVDPEYLMEELEGFINERKTIPKSDHDTRLKDRPKNQTGGRHKAQGLLNIRGRYYEG